MNIKSSYVRVPILMSILFVHCAQVKNLMERTLSWYGKLDFLVNNGGGQFRSSVAEMKTKGWLAVSDTNLNGTFNCCKQGILN